MWSCADLGTVQRLLVEERSNRGRVLYFRFLLKVGKLIFSGTAMEGSNFILFHGLYVLYYLKDIKPLLHFCCT